MAAHSSLGASSAHRWMACPGSIALIAKAPPQKSSPYADEGSAAHALAEKCLRTGMDAKQCLGETFPPFDKYPVTEEMATAVQVYLDVVREQLKLPGAKVLIEYKFNLEHIQAGMFGTNDSCVLQPYKTLYVNDYKHGAGVAVDAEDNEQLLYYALGAAKFGDFDEVEMCIVQPRAQHKDGPIRRWRITIEQLLEWEKTLKAAARATLDPQAPLAAGDHCRFCAAAPICPALRQKALTVAQATFSPIENTIVLPPVETIGEAEIKQVLDSADLFSNWLKSVQAHALMLATKGKPIPGYKMVRRKTNRVYADEEVARKELIAEFGEDAVLEPPSEPKLRSVAQLEKQLGKTKVKAIFERIVTKPLGEVTLASENDPRPAIPYQSAIDAVFDVIGPDYLD